MKGAVREARITRGCHIEALYTLRHFNREAAMRLFVVLVLSLVTPRDTSALDRVFLTNNASALVSRWCQHWSQDTARQVWLRRCRAVSPAFAQITSATISGTIKDETGGVLPGVGVASESITVTGETPLVDIRTSALSAVVDEKTIEELPLNGRNYIALATLEPGIVQFTEKSGAGSATRGVQLNINGMGGRSNSYLIDGANMKGYAGIATVTAADSTLGVETIREFRVVTNYGGTGDAHGQHRAADPAGGKVDLLNRNAQFKSQRSKVKSNGDSI
jgi:hypothetical protein